MIKEIVTDKKLLAIPSKQIHGIDLTNEIIQDLLDTAEYHQNKPPGCVGLAANQIGYLNRVIVIKFGAKWLPMINPSIEFIPNCKSVLAHEGCLSRLGVNRKIRRDKKIIVRYWDQNEDLIEQKFKNFDARVIQHEVNHLDGFFI